MDPQVYNWTCSICSFAWVINALDNGITITREDAAAIIGVPDCVNPSLGLISSDCLISAFSDYELTSVARYVTFEQAYAIASEHTGTINPQGMYHVMALRGVEPSTPAIYVANSALGYDGVYSLLTREQFNRYGPVEVVYLPDSRST